MQHIYQLRGFGLEQSSIGKLLVFTMHKGVHFDGKLSSCVLSKDAGDVDDCTLVFELLADETYVELYQ